MKTNQSLIDFYNTYDKDSRLEQKHGAVEFLTAMRYIRKYLKPGDRVLEIGADTGRYSHTLARGGHAVAILKKQPACAAGPTHHQGTKTGHNAAFAKDNIQSGMPHSGKERP